MHRYFQLATSVVSVAVVVAVASERRRRAPDGERRQLQYTKQWPWPIVLPPLDPNQWGVEGNLSKSEEHSLREVALHFAECSEVEEALIPGEGRTTLFLRFLRARKFEIDDSIKLLEDHLRWRRSFFRELDPASLGTGWRKDVLCLSDDQLEQLDTVYPKAIYVGSDRTGRPAFLRDFGKLRPSSCLRLVGGDFEPLIRMEMYHAERSKWILAVARCRLKRHVDTYTTVVDLRNLRMIDVSSLSLEFLRQLNSVAEVGLASHGCAASNCLPQLTAPRSVFSSCGVLQRNYPEMTGAMVVMNAPWWLKSVHGLVVSMLDARTANKIEFVDEISINEWFDERVLNQLGTHAMAEADVIADPVEGASRKDFLLDICEKANGRRGGGRHV